MHDPVLLACIWLHSLGSISEFRPHDDTCPQHHYHHATTGPRLECTPANGSWTFAPTTSFCFALTA